MLVISNPVDKRPNPDTCNGSSSFVLSPALTRMFCPSDRHPVPIVNFPLIYV
jgi:hypothetical protein